MNFPKEIVDLAKELFKPSLAFCVAVVCLVSFLVRNHSELGVVYSEGKPWILFFGLFYFLVWLVYCIVTWWNKWSEATAQAARITRVNDLIDRLNPPETYILGRLLAKGFDTMGFVTTEYRATISALELKQLIGPPVHVTTTNRSTITILPEIWELLQARRATFLARAAELNKEKAGQFKEFDDEQVVT